MGRIMSSASLKILAIGGDESFVRTLADWLAGSHQLAASANMDDAMARLSDSTIQAILLFIEARDRNALIQVSLLAVKRPKLPLVVIGPVEDGTFAAEVVRAGAQDYLPQSRCDAGLIEHAIRCGLERQQERSALIEEKDNYYGVFDHLVEGIFRTTPDGRYVLANIALARIYGYESPVELRASITDIAGRLYVEPGRREEFIQLMQANDTITGFESRIHRKDGTIIWISENCRAVRDGQGSILYYEGTVEDVTEGKHAEEQIRRTTAELSRSREELRISEALYHSLVETMPQNIFRKDLQGRFTFANQQYCNHYHCQLTEIVGRTDFDFFPRELAEKYKRDDDQVMQTGKTYEITEEHQPLGQKKTIVRVVKTPLRGPDGDVIGLQGIFWDITEQQRAEEQIRQANIELARSREELRASEALYHSLVETMHQAIFRKDLQGRYTFANRQFCLTLGKTYNEIIGRTIADFLPSEHAAARMDDDQRVITTGKPIESIEQSIFSDKPAYIHVVKIPIFDGTGRVAGVQGMFWDITEQRMAAERINKANAELSRSREELQAKNQLLEDNLRMAREIQTAMLPQQYPVFPRGATPAQSSLQFAHRYHPAESVSGDFFNVMALSETEAALFICDVAGHGIRAALVTAMIRALVEELKPFAREPGEFLRKLNSDLCVILKNTGSPMLTTAFYLIADSRTGATRFANAGHPKPLVLRRSAGRVDFLANACGRGQPALGLFDDPSYETSEALLSAGDMVMLFTDGLYEVQGQNEELYTQQRLMVDVKNLLDLPIGPMFDKLLENIRSFSIDRQFEDDVCLVGMEFTIASN